MSVTKCAVLCGTLFNTLQEHWQGVVRQMGLSDWQRLECAMLRDIILAQHRAIATERVHLIRALPGMCALHSQLATTSMPDQHPHRHSNASGSCNGDGGVAHAAAAEEARRSVRHSDGDGGSGVWGNQASVDSTVTHAAATVACGVPCSPDNSSVAAGGAAGVLACLQEKTAESLQAEAHVVEKLNATVARDR